MNFDPNDLQELEVILRPYNKTTDEAYIYSSWQNQSYYSPVERREQLSDKEERIRRSAFLKTQSTKICDVLKSSIIRIACLKDSPIVIIGYSVSTQDHLDWIYVKDSYRNKGIGKMLLPKNIKTFTNDLTKLGKIILDKKNLKEN